MPPTLPKSSNFLGISKKYSSYDSSKIVVLPVPYEHTVSYGKGTKYGPEAMIKASQFLEFYDEELRRELCCEVGIATLKPLSFGQKKRLVDESALTHIRKNVGIQLDAGKFVVCLGGEHTISFAPIAEYVTRIPSLSILQFDAHADLREEYEGNKFSHASVMARVAEILDPSKIVQVGIRAISSKEADYIANTGINTFFAHEIREGKYTRILKYWEDQVIERLSENVYITFDLDFFDPTIMPATGTPEPNGMMWHETMVLLRKLCQRKRIVGVDVVELSPLKGLNYPQYTAAKLVYKILNYTFENN